MARRGVLAGGVVATAWVSALPVVLTAPADGGFALDTPRGAWHSVLLAALVAVLALGGLALLGAPPRTGPQRVAAGVVGGIAWGAALRGFMAALAGPASVVTWLGTFGFLLLPSAVVGGLLGYAEHRRRRGRPGRRLTLVPLIFALDPSALLLVLPAMAGGWALAGRGTPTRRRLAWASTVVPVAAFLVIVALLGAGRTVLTPTGLAATVLLFSCFGVLTLACSIPFRAAPPPGPDTVESRSTVGVRG
ncbi:hypothetical protein Acsp06_40900 [Actinomycetospora sp. NBRC 106375]|uniref:hypothetical protein n=1 Tax=Actinomycetospora sp. NBRC 106375 TaxID=3032207 RepID=UPI0024A0B681|nr:hypothetical protein [Actinomycetospora sp. NBRC 106375]GLZ47905.1 hypothetical protein Acsp06_40900 [Actinomycetospora sp. NBRC 106375]